MLETTEESANLENFKPGIYLHYKGNLYEADHLMRDANDGSRVGVHYIGLELDGCKEGPRHIIRSWDDWNAWVHSDGSRCTNTNGVCGDTPAKSALRRFRYLGPFYKESMRQEKD